jgi:hypothetical protein
MEELVCRAEVPEPFCPGVARATRYLLWMDAGVV